MEATVRMSFADIWMAIQQPAAHDVRVKRGSKGEYALQSFVIGYLTYDKGDVDIVHDPGWKDSVVFQNDNEAEAFLKAYGFVEEEEGIWKRP